MPKLISYKDLKEYISQRSEEEQLQSVTIKVNDEFYGIPATALEITNDLEDTVDPGTLILNLDWENELLFCKSNYRQRPS